jgi:hypothetical protein
MYLIYKIFQEHFEYNSYSQECFGIKLQLLSYVYPVTNKYFWPAIPWPKNK